MFINRVNHNINKLTNVYFFVVFFRVLRSYSFPGYILLKLIVQSPTIQAIIVDGST